MIRRLLPFHIYQYVNEETDFERDFKILDKKGREKNIKIIKNNRNN